MNSRAMIISMIVFATLAGGCRTMDQKQNIEAEKAQIREVVENSIGWAANKDKDLVFSCFAEDEDLFYYSPRDDGTIRGRKAFVDLTEGFFMKDDFKAIGFEIRDFHVNLSRSGDVAWYHARLDDFNEWRGQPANWEDVRWTGVLEKRNGRWVIVQMHFSSPTDRAGNAGENAEP
jgi:ketosteroid isomerase-like protein